MSVDRERARKKEIYRFLQWFIFKWEYTFIFDIGKEAVEHDVQIIKAGKLLRQQAQTSVGSVKPL